MSLELATRALPKSLQLLSGGFPQPYPFPCSFRNPFPCPIPCPFRNPFPCPFRNPSPALSAAPPPGTGSLGT